MSQLSPTSPLSQGSGFRVKTFKQNKMKQSDLELRSHVQTVVSPTNGHGITCKTVAVIKFSTEIHLGNFVPSGENLKKAQIAARKELGEYVFGQTWREMEPIIYDIKRLATSQNEHDVRAIVEQIRKVFEKEIK